jgi:TetR/AcrR family transcriptional repressor of nem operon
MGRKPLVSRDGALDGVMRCFWSTGYEAASLEDLLAASSLHRGSFYRAFGGKRSAFEEALARYSELIGSEDLAPSVTGRGSPMDRLVRLTHARIDTVLGISRTFTSAPAAHQPDQRTPEEAGRPGCLVVNTALELGPHDDALRAELARALDAVRTVIALLVREAIEQGEADPRLDVRAAADQILALLMGVTVLASVGTRRRELRRTLADGVRSVLQPTTNEGRSK